MSPMKIFSCKYILFSERCFSKSETISISQIQLPNWKGCVARRGRKQNPILSERRKKHFSQHYFLSPFCQLEKNERKKFFFDNIFLKKIERKIYHRVCEKESVCKWVCVVRVCVWKEWEIYTLIIKVFWPCVHNKPPSPWKQKVIFWLLIKWCQNFFCQGFNMMKLPACEVPPEQGYRLVILKGQISLKNNDWPFGFVIVKY